MGDDAFLNRGFTFQCPAWRTCAFQEVLLTKVGVPMLPPPIPLRRRHPFS